ncbi:MAG: class I lanthipeptide [Chitinophaga sp.]|uniref:class I lanthipeptide n=1 Tax=Chitinophaga sp. TaxID=1869181 RepID=UPI0025C15893|nr:class I lanthipeptide [Chitinophaga sp.]MBV8251922.1 class I lanthipeptide [Chitinophaga sp.]
MKKKIQLPRLVLNKKIVARLTAAPSLMQGGKFITDPTTENPCDPISVMMPSCRKIC